MTQKLDILLAEWRENHTKINGMQEAQNELAAAINVEFGKTIREKRLLANLPWQVELPGRVVLLCDIRNEEVDKFLDKMEWDDNRFDYHHSLKLGEFCVFLDDGTARISFENVEEMIGF